MLRSEFITLCTVLDFIAKQLPSDGHDPDFKHMVIRNLKTGKDEYDSIKAA